MTPLPTTWSCGLITHIVGMVEGGRSEEVKAVFECHGVTDKSPADEKVTW